MPEQTEAQRAIVDQARDHFKRCVDWESTARVRQDADIRFGNGDSYNNYQWPDAYARDRVSVDKPVLTINKTRQHCLQVINDARQNKVGIKVRAVGGGATFLAAQAFEGLIRHIEYQSNATAAYDKATWDQVYGGIGYWTVETDYIDQDSRDQEIYIRRVPDWRMVYLDPDIQEYDGSDANFGFIFADMPNERFEAKYPGYKALSKTTTLSSSDSWNTKDHTRVAKYYVRSTKTDTLFWTPDGTTMRASLIVGTPLLAMLRADKTIQSRKIVLTSIKCYKIAADCVIEETDWAGSYIPIIRVVGEETVLDGILDRKGHVRAMINAQQMYNYYTSTAVEYGALQSKAPYIAAGAAIEGREVQWANANTDNAAVLTYNHMDEDGNVLPAPQRQPAPTQSQAYIIGMQTASQEIMAVSGQFQAEMGMPGNERSGVAITQRQRQGDNATYHFIDHLAMAIRYTGKVIIDLVPKIYDTARVARILAEDGSDAEIQLDPNATAAHQVDGDEEEGKNVYDTARAAKLIFNPGVGRYEVQSDVGPSFGTQRQEAFNAFVQIVSQNKELMAWVGDIMFKNADFPGADELAERLKHAVPAIANGGPPPEVAQAQQQVQQLQGLLQQMTEALADEKKKSADATKKLETEEYNAETRRMDVAAKIDPMGMLPIVRQMVADIMGERPEPHIRREQEFNQSVQPAAPGANPLAVADAAHTRNMDVARLGLDAQAQEHQQAMDLAAQEQAAKSAGAPVP